MGALNGRRTAGAVRIWLHEGHDGEPGVEALGLDHLGFATWAESEDELRAKLPAKFAAYCNWRARHQLAVAAIDDAGLEVAGRLAGNEILFPPDREPAHPTEIELAIALLAASRADLMTLLEAAPDAALDWDPPYRRFAPWADWRSVRAILAHVANGETHYYLRNVGHEPVSSPADPRGDWRDFLPRSRSEAIGFLETMKRASDRSRIGRVDFGFGEEWWSLRKALRRMVSHELTHAKSIARILRAHAAAG